MASSARPRVALFVTCLVDLFRPTVGFAAIRLLEQAGCIVEVPPAQTCCGQPAFNSGDRATAADIARAVIAAVEGYDFIVAPSGSCAGMIRAHYPALLGNDPQWKPRAEAIAARTHELVAFLHDIMGVRSLPVRHEGRVTYHDSCSGLRELGVKAQPRALLAAVEGLSLVEMQAPDVCCGFGGTFCVKYPAISDRMVADKADDAEQSGASLLLAGDMGCLLNIAGKLKRRGSGLAVRHVAELLAGMAGEAPPIGEPKA